MKRIENISFRILDEIDIAIAISCLSQKEALQESIPSKKILIVDDQEFNIDALMIILKYTIKLKDSNQICDCVYDGK